MKKSASGFSVVELLLVVAVISIIASLSVSGLMASRRSANEGSAVATLRILHGAQMTYATSFGGGEFAGAIGSGDTTALTTLGSQNLIDESVRTANKAGYNFVGARETSTLTAPAQFYFSGIPVNSSLLTKTGNHRIGVATDGIIRQDEMLDLQYRDVTEVLAAPPIGN